jgi:hypothetical protein
MMDAILADKPTHANGVVASGVRSYVIAEEKVSGLPNALIAGNLLPQLRQPRLWNIPQAAR